MSRTRKTILSTALLATTTLSIAWAMQPAHEAPRPAQPAAKGQPAMPADCASMGKMRAEMIAQQTEADARLDGLVAAMNGATGAMKADAMAAVISELVKQRTDDHARMADMQSEMMQHMMQHVMDAAPAEMREKMHMQMDECPMMKPTESEGNKHPGGNPLKH